MERLEGPEYPAGLLIDVLEAGRYKAAFYAKQRAETKTPEKSELEKLVDEIDADKFREAVARHQAQEGSHG